MKKLALTAAMVTLAVILALAGPLQAAPRYIYQDLGPLGEGTAMLMASTTPARWWEAQ